MSRYHVQIPLHLVVEADSEAEARLLAKRAISVDAELADRQPLGLDGHVFVSMDLRDRPRRADR